MAKDWEKEEMILALDFYITHRPKMPDQNSEELNLLLIDIHKVQKIFGHDKEDFRTLNSLNLRNSNYLAVDPTDDRKGMDGGIPKCKPVWDQFSNNWENLFKTAIVIRDWINTENIASTIKDTIIIDDYEVADEGKLLTKIHLVRERDNRIVKIKKQQFKEANGSLFCEACGLNFENKYGDRGKDFIECHHTRPLSEGPGTTHLAHLRLLCSNCHRMVHRKKPWLSFEGLKSIINS